MSVYIPDGQGDAFTAHLRTLPDEEAAALAKVALREGFRERNGRELFKSKAFKDWMLEMDKRGLFGDPTPAPEECDWCGEDKQVRHQTELKWMCNHCCEWNEKGQADGI